MTPPSIWVKSVIIEERPNGNLGYKRLNHIEVRIAYSSTGMTIKGISTQKLTFLITGSWVSFSIKS
ncbi:hypothetical protein SAMN05421766_10327 [Zobellia uliginosa]|uniref:Uncharacterized protein n=1 Tax=Zobellia uliginosa TaxID=143224 RepID=A0ABY1KQA7_9FLAO|nr:hypothetical protein SAMN05421766_10327 [Zobellia uliginosa]